MWAHAERHLDKRHVPQLGQSGRASQLGSCPFDAVNLGLEWRQGPGKHLVFGKLIPEAVPEQVTLLLQVPAAQVLGTAVRKAQDPVADDVLALGSLLAGPRQVGLCQVLGQRLQPRQL